MSAVPIPVVECPKFVRNFCDYFKDLCGSLGDYQSFVALLSAAVFGTAGLSTIARYFLFSPSVSTMSRFLATEGLADKLNRRHRRRLKRILTETLKDPDRFQFALDDTLIGHDGKSMWGVYSWYDHCKKSYMSGHKLLVLGLVDKKRNILIPLTWEILHREIECGKDHETAWQVALRLLQIAVDSGFPKFVLAADSWFFGEQFCAALVAKGFDYVIETKSNLVVEKHINKNVKQSLTLFFEKRIRRMILWKNKSKFISEAVVSLKALKGVQVKIVAVANRRKLDDKVFAYYASNQLAWDASKIWKYSRGRWTIEVMFRELKQFFTLGEAAVRSQKSIETEVSISMIALTVIRLEQLAVADLNKNQKCQPFSAGRIVRNLQMNSASRSILKLAMKPHKKSVQKLKLRYNQQNLNSKPAEKRKKNKVPEIKMSYAQAA